METEKETKNEGVFEKVRRSVLDKLEWPSVLRTQKCKQHTFVMVHEAGLGAWSWFKVSHLLKTSLASAPSNTNNCYEHQPKLKLKNTNNVICVDLVSSGLDPTRPHQLFTLHQYSQPLLSILSALPESHKVILVGHGLGGLSVAYASEMFASKIAVAVYLAGLMFPNGLAALQQHIDSAMEKAVELPWLKAAKCSGILSTDDLYNTCPPEEVELGRALQRGVPSVLTEAAVETTEEGYGSVARVYVKTKDDLIVATPVQEEMIRSSTAHKVLTIHSDHCPNFSAPSNLAHMLLGLAQVYDTDST